MLSDNISLKLSCETSRFKKEERRGEGEGEEKGGEKNRDYSACQEGLTTVFSQAYRQGADIL